MSVPPPVLTTCFCGQEIVPPVRLFQTCIVWSAFHGFVDSMEHHFVRMIHLTCLPRWPRSPLGVLTLAYVLQPDPPKETYAAYLQQWYPEVMAQLDALCTKTFGVGSSTAGIATQTLYPSPDAG